MDMIQWLRETGGNNAIQQRVQSQTNQTNTSTQKNQTAVPEAATYTAGTTKTVAPAYTRTGYMNDTDTNGNRVDFGNGSRVSNRMNTRSAGTVNNTIDFSSTRGVSTDNAVTVNGMNNFIRGYNGNQKNNRFDITGNSNRVLAGKGAAGNTVKVSGNSNVVHASDNAADNTLSVQGNNVKINVGMAGSPQANSGWNIHVAANNVEVSISNGKAKVNVSDEMKDTLKISIDEKTKTVSVSEIA